MFSAGKSHGGVIQTDSDDERRSDIFESDDDDDYSLKFELAEEFLELKTLGLSVEGWKHRREHQRAKLPPGEKTEGTIEGGTLPIKEGLEYTPMENYLPLPHPPPTCLEDRKINGGKHIEYDKPEGVLFLGR